MSADKTAVKAVRLSVVLHPEVASVLELLASKHGLTITNEIRRDIALAHYLDREIEEGAKILIERGGYEREVLLKDWLKSN